MSVRRAWVLCDHTMGQHIAGISPAAAWPTLPLNPSRKDGVPVEFVAEFVRFSGVAGKKAPCFCPADIITGVANQWPNHFPDVQLILRNQSMLQHVLEGIPPEELGSSSDTNYEDLRVEPGLFHITALPKLYRMLGGTHFPNWDEFVAAVASNSGEGNFGELASGGEPSSCSSELTPAVAGGTHIPAVADDACDARGGDGNHVGHGVAGGCVFRISLVELS